MLKYIFPLALISTFLVPSATEWKEYVSFEGKFKILTPVEVEERQTEIETALGPIVYHTLFGQEDGAKVDNYVYMVSYCDYPEFSVHSDSTELLQEFFEETINSATESVGGTLMYSSEITLKGYPGRLWRIDYKDDSASIKTKAYVVGRRFYSIQTVTLREKSLNPSIDKFLDSFKLID